MSKILLVEDNDRNRELLSRRLERRGYEVVVATHGEEGLAKARAEEPDLILMDLTLPVLDGWEAARILKAEPRTQRIPIIGLTGHAVEGDEEKARDAGCDALDTKPVEMPRLIGKIEALLLRRGGSA
ncbi:MAG TPA: response regulator [Thermoanaerobaculia bacterium]|nr:response regulator [Thermoanaerobaculia bacterium]